MTIYDLFFPPRCPYCDELTGCVCEACGKCMKLMDNLQHTQLLRNGTLCISAIPYLELFKSSILRYKYGGYRQYYKAYSVTLSRLIDHLYSYADFDVFTSVPARYAFPSNRFDHVGLLAEAAAKRCGTAYEPLLIKTRITGFQHELTVKEREKNVIDLYKIRSGANVENKSILLFDDVITTGSTLTACSDALISGGAKSVCAITLLY